MTPIVPELPIIRSRQEVEQWARRVAALQSGLRAYRFFALKLADGSEG